MIDLKKVWGGIKFIIHIAFFVMVLHSCSEYFENSNVLDCIRSIKDVDQCEKVFRKNHE